MNSILGVIELGIWELGSVQVAASVGIVRGIANPQRDLATQGGVTANYSAVVGFITLGLFELGQVYIVPIITESGAIGIANPIRRIAPAPTTGAALGKADPIRLLTPNKGVLVCFGRGKPNRSITYVFYYPEANASGNGTPTRTLAYFESGAAVGFGTPVRELSTITGQQISCVTGDLLEVSGEILNGSW